MEILIFGSLKTENAVHIAVLADLIVLFIDINFMDEKPNCHIPYLFEY